MKREKAHNKHQKPEMQLKTQKTENKQKKICKNKSTKKKKMSNINLV